MNAYWPNAGLRSIDSYGPSHPAERTIEISSVRARVKKKLRKNCKKIIARVRAGIPGSGRAPRGGNREGTSGRYDNEIKGKHIIAPSGAADVVVYTAVYLLLYGRRDGRGAARRSAGSDRSASAAARARARADRSLARTTRRRYARPAVQSIRRRRRRQRCVTSRVEAGPNESP